MKLRCRAYADRIVVGRNECRMVLSMPARYGRDLSRFQGWIQKVRERRDGEDVELDLIVEGASSARTLDQNALMWALYEIEADVMNGGRIGPGAVTKDELYDRDMEEHAPVVTVEIAKDQIDAVARLAKIKETRPSWSREIFAIVDIMITSSKWDTKRMALHIDMQFDRLASMGVPMATATDVLHYWREWRRHLNDRKIVLHEELMTEEEYRERNPICESCGKYVGDGSGILAHISTRGSGVTTAEEKARPSDWLHLCPSCELWRTDSIHRGGWTKFIEQAPHLKFKVMRALKRLEEVS